MEIVSLMSGLNISDVLFCEHQSTEMVRSWLLYEIDY